MATTDSRTVDAQPGKAQPGKAQPGKAQPGKALLDALTSDPRPGGAEMVHYEMVDVGERRAAVLTLCRPERHNALNLAAWEAISNALDEVAEDRAVHAVVIRGAGGRAFSAGADISEFPQRRIGGEPALTYNETVSRALASVVESPVPVIAMVNGLAVGGGCELAAACDVRLATAGSRFGIPAGKLGVTLGLTETRVLNQAIGPANLKYLLFSGELISAGQALNWGLVQRVLETDEIAEAAVALVSSICASSEVTIRSAKQVTDLAGADPFATDEHQLLRSLHEEAYGGEDLREGVAAFLERRPPRFRNRRR